MSVVAKDPYRPPWWLKNAHAQTVFSSRGRSYWVERRAASFRQASERQVIATDTGSQLEAWFNLKANRPAIVIIHGWLGHADSSYVLSAAATLADRGFSVVRLNLRDHGKTAHLNEQIIHSARIDDLYLEIRHRAEIGTLRIR